MSQQSKTKQFVSSLYNLMERINQVVAPIPLKNKAAYFLWGAIMLYGMCGKLSQSLEKLFLAADVSYVVDHGRLCFISRAFYKEFRFH